jgi:hypothetical protein
LINKLINREPCALVLCRSFGLSISFANALFVDLVAPPPRRFARVIARGLKWLSLLPARQEMCDATDRLTHHPYERSRKAMLKSRYGETDKSLPASKKVRKPSPHHVPAGAKLCRLRCGGD